MTEAAPPHHLAPHSSQLHPHPHHPTSSLYGAPPPLHSRHPTLSSSTALHPHPHSHAQHRSTATARQRFGPALAEEGAAPDSAAARLRAEKARMYDRAFAHSALLASASGGGPGAAGLSASYRGGPASSVSRRGRLGTVGPSTDAIDEESALDGDVFVAPTDAQPFGLPMSDEEDEEQGRAGGGAEVERLRRRGLGGLMSEMMSRP